MADQTETNAARESDAPPSPATRPSSPVECECLASVPLPDTFPEASAPGLHEILYLPAGIQTISPVQGPTRIAVQVDQATAVTLEAHRKAIEQTTGKRTYFDFRHEDREASFWPKEFLWRSSPRPGVYARGEFSAAGRAGVQGRMWREFSPRCWLDRQSATEQNPARVIAVPTAKPNLGGFVNDGAFSGVSIWSQRTTLSDLPSPNPCPLTPLNPITPTTHMTDPIPTQISANATDELAKARLQAQESEQRAIKAELAAARADAEIKARNKTLAQSAISAARKRGAIPTQGDKAADIEARFLNMIEQDPSNIVLIENFPGSELLASRLTTGQPVSISRESNTDVLKKLVQISAAQRNIHGFDPVASQQRGAHAREFAKLYRTEIAARIAQGDPIEIAAATTTDADVGSLAGDLITQRTLELLKYQFPALSRVTSDFSDQPASYGQTIISRYMTVPTIATYSTSTGWTTPGSNPTATDASIVINQHKGVPIRFQENQLAGTMRRLFDEFAPAAAYCLAKDIVDALYALITAANFTNTAIKADASAFGRSEVIDIGTALNKRGVPMGPANRTLLVNSDYFGSLAKDTAIVTLSAYQRPEIIEQGVLPNVHGFGVVDAPNLPTTGSLAGFGFSKSALVIASRLPNDYSSVLPGSSYGSVTTVTDPDLGLSVMQVQYVDHKLGFAESRLALMYGVGVGQQNAGQRLTSA